MSEPLTVNHRITIPTGDMVIEVSRSGGAGGQHVNKTESRVRLRFMLNTCEALRADVKARIRASYPGQMTESGELLLVASTHRSQHRNLEEVRERLATIIRAALIPPKKRRPTRPTRGSQERRLAAKKRNSAVKQGRRRPRRED